MLDFKFFSAEDEKVKIRKLAGAPNMIDSDIRADRELTKIG